MFGNKVTDVDVFAEGSNGYVIRVDTTSILAYSITGIQAQIGPSDTPEPVTEETTLPELLSFLNDGDSVDLAFNYGYGEVYIFFKASIFPYVDTTRFILIGKRNPLKLASFNSKLDIADKDIELFLAYAIRTASLLARESVPFQIEKTIKAKEQEIRNANS